MAETTPLFSSKFYFIRHGESVANAAHQFAGQIDVELTERGRQDAVNAVKWIKDEDIGSIFSSPLQRVWKTAEPAAKVFGLNILSVPGIDISGFLFICLRACVETVIDQPIEAGRPPRGAHPAQQADDHAAAPQR